MLARLLTLLGLGLLLASCDRPRKSATERAQQPAAPRLTKSARPAPEDPPQTRDSVRAAFKAAAEIASPEEKNRALAAAIWEAMDLEPELARQGLHQLTAGSEEKSRLIQHFAMRLAEHNVDDAVQWAAALETEEEQSQAFGRIAMVLADQEPARAAHLLSDSGLAGRDFDVAVVQVVQRWAAQSPSAAAAWVVLFDPGEARSAGLRETIGVWVRKDAQAAFSWIAAVQDAQTREDAVTGMVETMMNQPASERMKLLELAPPEIRTRFENLKAGSGRE